MNGKFSQHGDILRSWIKAANTSQSEVAEVIGVSRAAVSKWCAGEMCPSEESAQLLEHISGRDVPATIWPRRQLPEPKTKGARALQKAAKKRGLNIFEMSRLLGLPERGMHRWACSLNAPRQKTLAKINAKLGLNLRVDDFEVRA